MDRIVNLDDIKLYLLNKNYFVVLILFATIAKGISVFFVWLFLIDPYIAKYLYLLVMMVSIGYWAFGVVITRRKLTNCSTVRPEPTLGSLLFPVLYFTSIIEHMDWGSRGRDGEVVASILMQYFSPVLILLFIGDAIGDIYIVWQYIILAIDLMIIQIIIAVVLVFKKRVYNLNVMLDETNHQEDITRAEDAVWRSVYNRISIETLDTIALLEQSNSKSKNILKSILGLFKPKKRLLNGKR